jgi:WD40 repeat protein
MKTLIDCFRELKCKLEGNIRRNDHIRFYEEKLSTVENYFCWIRKERTTLRTNPRYSVLYLASGEPIGSIVYNNLNSYKQPLESLLLSSSWDKCVGQRTIIMGRIANERYSSDCIEYNLSRRDGSYRAVHWHPTKMWLASVSQEDVVDIWNMENGELLRTLEGNAVEWHPFQNLLLASLKGDIVVWNVDRGERVFQLLGYSVGRCWHPSGDYFLVERRPGYYLWDFVGNNCIKKIEISGSLITSANIRPRISKVDYTSHGWYEPARMVIMCSNRDHPYSILFYNVENDELHEDMLFQDIHTDRVTQIILLQNGKGFISSSWDHSIIIWDIQSKRCRHRLLGHTDKIVTITCDDHQRFVASASWDRTLRIWLIDGGDCLIILKNYLNDYSLLSIDWKSNLIAFPPGGSNVHVLNVSKKEISSLLVWDDTSRKERIKIIKKTNTEDPLTVNKYLSQKIHICSMQFLNDASLATVSAYGNSIKIWNSATGQLIDTVETTRGDKDVVVAYNPVRDMIAVGSSGFVEIFDLAENRKKQSHQLQEHLSRKVTDLVWNTDGSYLAVKLYYPAGNRFSSVEILNLKENSIMEYREIKEAPILFRFDPSDKSLAAVLFSGKRDMNRVEIWNFIENRLHQALPEKFLGARTFSWHPMIAGCLAIAVADSILLWNVKTQVEMSVFHCPDCLLLDWLMGGKYLVAGLGEPGKHIIKLWNSSSGELLEKITLGSSRSFPSFPSFACQQNGNTMAFSPYGTGDVIFLDPVQING